MSKSGEQSTQASLFQLEEIQEFIHKNGSDNRPQLPRTESKIVQSNVITMGRYEMSALEKNILYMLMAEVKPNDVAGKPYRISGTKLMRMTEKQIRPADFIAATKKLNTRLIETEDIKGNYFHTTFLSSATYLKGEGIIEITLSEKIRPYYIELRERFTSMQLDTALNLSGKYSKRLFEILSMHKSFNNPEFRISVRDLKYKLGIIDEKGKDTYSNYAIFRSVVLEKSKYEINNFAGVDINFDYEEILGQKSGRGRKPVETLVFRVTNLNKQIQLNESLFTALTTEFGLRKDQAAATLKNYSEEEIRKKLFDMRNQKRDGTIRNLGAYAAKTFNVI
jgi:plasmid replication initiation protein